MTTFDALKDGQEYDVDICRVTGKPHEYVEMESYEKDGKMYQPLKCKICGKYSVGWHPLDT